MQDKLPTPWGWFTSAALSLHQEAGMIFRAQVVTHSLNYLSILYQGRKQTKALFCVFAFFFFQGLGETCLHFPCFMHSVYMICRQLKIPGFDCAWGLPLFTLGVFSCSQKQPYVSQPPSHTPSPPMLLPSPSSPAAIMFLKPGPVPFCIPRYETVRREGSLLEGLSAWQAFPLLPCLHPPIMLSLPHHVPLLLKPCCFLSRRLPPTDSSSCLPCAFFSRFQ